ncbi:MAG: hypothetical protein KDD60_05495, partial [Bdellovibrionales bacterium]|nr:hypothetical protein [Bdellovibrionales bacterium]
DAGDTRFRPGNLLLTIRQWSTVLLIDRNSGDVVWKYTGNLSGGHEGIMLSKDFAGSGNILIFNNGRDQHRSEVLEIDPLSQESIWTFQDGEAFFSRVAGISQRLPNGNTLISEDVPGRIFEVSPAGERVWQYNAGIRVERAHRYAQEYCPQLSTLPLVGD